MSCQIKIDTCTYYRFSGWDFYCVKFEGPYKIIVFEIKSLYVLSFTNLIKIDLPLNFFKCTKPYVFSTSLPFPNQHGSNEKVKPFSILKFHLVYSRIYDLLLVRTYVSNWKEFLKFVLKEFLAMMIFKIDTYHSKLIVYCIHLLNNKQKVREETLMYPSSDQSVSKHTSRSGGGE